MDGILTVDQRMPRKQRHTARRIWQRVQAEMPEQRVAESTVREYVRGKKKQLGLSQLATCIPQTYAPGQEAQVNGPGMKAGQNWTALSQAPGVRHAQRVKRRAAFHRAYFRATQQAFLEAHELAFAFFGGVFRNFVTTISKQP